MSWTPEREESLKQMWLSGEFSAQQIADRLGNVTRNAVIGKANRLKLSKILETKPGRIGRPAGQSAKNSRNGKINIEPLKKNRVKNLSSSNKDKALIEPKFLKLKLLDLTESTCKWPVNGETEKDYCFCGVNTNATSPYCEYHANKAFHNMKSRQRKSA